jgi:integrase/recombinase XerD
MRVVKASHEPAGRIQLVDDSDKPIAIVTRFLSYLAGRGYSPNTLVAYCHDLKHLFVFLDAHGLDLAAFTPPRAVDFLLFLNAIGDTRPCAGGQIAPTTPIELTADEGPAPPVPPAKPLAATTINRILAAVSSFFEYLILAEEGMHCHDNPIRKVPDPATARVSPRVLPFRHLTVRQRPVRRVLRVRTVQRLPRPLSEGQVAALLNACKTQRDRAMFLLMLHGGLRPGEVLNLHLEDIQYGRRRVVVRHRTDHPKGARTKSRTERLVDLHDQGTLAALSAYVMGERPSEAPTSHVFLVGGHGPRRHEPLGYAALAKAFRRRCRALGLDEPWLTLHALRHTHATAMWEGGMRELALQKRLGHASPESTRLYTRVSDAAMVADYRRALGLEAEHHVSHTEPPVDRGDGDYGETGSTASEESTGEGNER